MLGPEEAAEVVEEEDEEEARKRQKAGDEMGKRIEALAATLTCVYLNMYVYHG